MTDSKFVSLLLGAGVVLGGETHALSFDDESQDHPFSASFVYTVEDIGLDEQSFVNGSCSNGGCSANGSC